MKLDSLHGLFSSRARTTRIGGFVLALGALLLPNLLAINSSLQPEEVQNAYSLGQTTNHEDLVDFLNQYEHDFKYPSDHPDAYVSSVEFQTPYEQIVLRSLRTANYSKFQAAEDYRANPGLIIVRVVVALRANYTGPVPPADSFKVVVYQGEPIEPRKLTSTVTCDPYSYASPTFGNCIFYTREILLQFDASQFAPGMATVKVTLPFGQSMETKYNLNKLK